MNAESEPDTPEQAQDRLFFIHVMKTAGTTFTSEVRRNYRRAEIYPNPKRDTNALDAYIIPEYLLGLREMRKARIRVFLGHFPYFVASLLGDDIVTATILRDPIDRTISYLHHCARRHPQHMGLPIEQIYEDQITYEWFIHNHQTKIFGRRAEDGLESIMTPLLMDDGHLERAKQNIDRVDVLGFTEAFPAFQTAMRRRFGWPERSTTDRNVGVDAPPPPASLLRRIESDNRADLELYEHARATRWPGDPA